MCSCGAGGAAESSSLSMAVAWLDDDDDADDFGFWMSKMFTPEIGTDRTYETDRSKYLSCYSVHPPFRLSLNSS